MPAAVVERALRVLPHVDLVNAYGLTETSSTVALLGPEHHRSAFASGEESVRARLGSVGQALPGIELSIRDPDGTPSATGAQGEIWVRGEQVSGEYMGATLTDEEGWFHTRDAGHLDEEGFLFVHGRLDDVIVRGGENLSPGEIEEVLVSHPGVESAAVVGIPDTEWGERVVAAVVLTPGASVTEEQLKEHVAARLRSARTPERIKFMVELPFNENGKLLRRILRDELTLEFESP
jgi:acyl-CoA synthetase (AMP-forming)/AMP-acid ligase II